MRTFHRSCINKLFSIRLAFIASSNIGYFYFVFFSRGESTDTLICFCHQHLSKRERREISFVFLKLSAHNIVIYRAEEKLIVPFPTRVLVYTIREHALILISDAIVSTPSV